MERTAVTDVLQLMGVVAVAGPATLKDVAASENGNWLVETAGGDRVVLRRYHLGATADDLAYEHAVLRGVASLGWVVPTPVGDPLEHGGRWWSLRAYVPGAAVRDESVGQRRRRGRDMARLELAMRDVGLAELLGQRIGWRPQHTNETIHTDLDWGAAVAALAARHPWQAEWALAAAEQVRDELAAIGAAALPLVMVHGDFAEWNVHYGDDGRLAGVVDFGLAHLDSRPYELAIARTYRAPEAIEAYTAELAANGWPLSELEHAAMGPVHRAFRVDMVAWTLRDGERAGAYDVQMIERQLRLTGVAPPSRCR